INLNMKNFIHRKRSKASAKNFLTIVAIAPIIIISLVFQSCHLFTNDELITIYDWKTDNPNNQGLNSIVLDEAVSKAGDLDFIHSLLIIKNDRLVVEEYYNDHFIYDYFNMASATKSVMSTLIGIALDGGYLTSVDQKVLSFFPEHTITAADSLKQKITIKHLLTMTAGIPGDNSWEVLNIGDSGLIAGILDLNLINAPGERFTYSSSQTHLLSAILTRATGLNTKTFAEYNLLTPLGIDIDFWDKDFSGVYYGSTGIYAKSRNFARLGQLFLHDGKIGDQQIISKAWIEQATSDQTHRVGRIMGEIKKVNYGYNWWVGELDSYKCYYAYGYGGQFMFCFPELNMIIVTTADIPTYRPGNENKIISLISEYILSSVQ
ncbi:serine hydrolase domain-containing protein, partial [Candidatus Neomarinimicrobiota bacterium]